MAIRSTESAHCGEQDREAARSGSSQPRGDWWWMLCCGGIRDITHTCRYVSQPVRLEKPPGSDQSYVWTTRVSDCPLLYATSIDSLSVLQQDFIISHKRLAKGTPPIMRVESAALVGIIVTPCIGNYANAMYAASCSFSTNRKPTWRIPLPKFGLGSLRWICLCSRWMPCSSGIV